MNIPFHFEIALKSALKGAEFVLLHYPNNFEVFVKPDNSPVTSIDLKVHSICQEELSKTDFPFVSEEGEIPLFSELKTYGKFWCIDPIDGTQDLVKKTDNFCISIGLIDTKTSYAGILIAPALNKFYFAEESLGSYVFNGDLVDAISWIAMSDFSEKLLSQSIRLPLSVSISPYTLLSSNYFKGEKDREYQAELAKIEPELQVQSIGSVIKLGLVAEGLAHEYTRWAAVNFWDAAAGHAIVKYAGLELMDPKTNQPINYNNPDLIVKRYSVKNTKK